MANPRQALLKTSRFLNIEPFSSDNEYLDKKVFPGPDRKPTGSGGNQGITIQLDALDRQVEISASDIDWLTRLYQADQAALSRLLAATPAWSASATGAQRYEPPPRD